MCVEPTLATAETAISTNGNGHHAGGAARPAVHIERFTYITDHAPAFHDITDDVRGALRRSGMRDGSVVVFSRHTTAAIRINEAEPLLLQDMESMLARIAPANVYYRHNDLTVRTVNLVEDEDLNGHAHCQHLLMGASEAVPCAGGEMLLGRWQRIFLVELDCPREREVIVQAVGVGG